MIIRKEEVKDYEEVYNLVRKAFESAKHTDGNEEELVSKLRMSDSFIQELSLVAEIDGKLVGHILFSKGKVNDDVVLVLAPLSVLPKYQNQGIGSALIKEGHRIAKDLGYSYSIVLGDNQYYSKFGYIPAINYGIEPPFDVPSKYFMALKLQDKAKDISGKVKYDEAFNL